jgi:hypothetical protein
LIINFDLKSNLGAYHQITHETGFRIIPPPFGGLLRLGLKKGIRLFGVIKVMFPVTLAVSLKITCCSAGWPTPFTL